MKYILQIVALLLALMAVLVLYQKGPEAAAYYMANAAWLQAMVASRKDDTE